jgi:hypothetical protein
MLKQLTSAIAYSPSLVDEVIEQENLAKKRLRANSVALIFVFLALLSQGVLLTATTSNSRGTPNDIVYGGLTDKNTAHTHCLRQRDFQDVLAYYQITCEQLVRGSLTTLNSDDYSGYLSSIGRTPRPSAQSSDPSRTSSHKIAGKLYYSYLLQDWHPRNQAIQAIKVKNRQGVSHYVSMDSGSVIYVNDPTPQINLAINNPSVLSQTTSNYTDEALIKSISADNLSREHSSTTAIKDAQAGDLIIITLKTHNSDLRQTTDYQPRIFVGDILEYATIIDYDGEQISSDKHEIVWPTQSLKPQETSLQYFTIQVNSPLSNSALSSRDPMSKDLKIEAKYGNSVVIVLKSDKALKNLEIVSSQANHINTTHLSIALAVLFIGLVLISLHNQTVLAHLKIIKKRRF